MKSPLIDVVAGARPNFMKIAPLIHAFEKHRSSGGALRYRLVHTGQHYDVNMSEDFFRQLNIPQPDINLGVGSGPHAEQTASIMIGYERLLSKAPSDLCLVVGDVNSTLACSVVAGKMQIPIAHVEGGLRSNDWSMPEEINRIVTDSLSKWFFTTSITAGENLVRSGVSSENIFFVGNTMVDTLLGQLPHLRQPSFWNECGLKHGEYFVMTLHRPKNVDVSDHLNSIITAVSEGARGLPVIFPVHPRTRKALQTLTNVSTNLRLIDPQPYLEFNYLVRHSKAVVTDSGGITEETTMMGVPCMTLRDNTERPETVTYGTNEVIGTSPALLPKMLDRIFAGEWKRGAIPEKWDGKTSDRIVEILERLLIVK